MTEWRPVVGFEGRYEISDDGQVKVLAGPGRGRFNQDRILKVGKTTTGYRQVVLYPRDGKSHVVRRVHHLVLESFVGPRPEGAWGLHLDDDRENNHFSNLRWGNQSDNTFDMVRNGNHNHARKTHCKWGHSLSGDNLIITTRQRACRECAHRRNAKWDARRVRPARPLKVCPACSTSHTRRSKFCSDACRVRTLYRLKVGTPIDAPLYQRAVYAVDQGQP